MSFSVHEYQFSLRSVQGYRYLDRCGELLIRLENTLGDGWLTGDIAPTGGVIKNEPLGLAARFDSSGLVIAQSEFIDQKAFIDSATRITEVFLSTLQIEKLNAPTLAMKFQRGFESVEEAEAALLSMNLVQVRPDVVAVLGSQTAGRLVYVSEADQNWAESQGTVRRRLEIGVVRQMRRSIGVDQRLLQRVRLLPGHQRTALLALQALAAKERSYSPIAIELTLEKSHEVEFSTKAWACFDFIESANSDLTSISQSISQLGAK